MSLISVLNSIFIVYMPRNSKKSIATYLKIDTLLQFKCTSRSIVLELCTRIEIVWYVILKLKFQLNDNHKIIMYQFILAS